MTVNGSSRNERIQVTASGTQVTVSGTPETVVVSNAESIDRLIVNGNDGNDVIDASTLAAGVIGLTIDGGAGNDVITGSQGDDTLDGGDGNDKVTGGRGNDFADLGAGDGSFSLLLAQQAAKVIAIDSSARMIEVGRDQAKRQGAKNVEFHLGDIEEVPLADASVDLAFFSQSLHHALHPERAVHEAWRIVRPGGRIVILDLAKHRFEEAREMYADEWLGFSEAELEAMLEKAGFHQVKALIVDKEPDTPQFQTLLAIGTKRA